MVENNVTDIRAARLADLIMAEWLDSQSDSGAIWLQSHEALKVAKAEHSEQIVQEALEIAHARWKKMFNVKS
jgi:predicted 2-oxoglutarate/Fe(II)-dependent dioxygenase YbiX